MDPFVLVMFGIAAALIVAIAIGSVYHVKKAKFKPVFRRLSDGSLQMEFTGFGGLQTTRTERFQAEYPVGRQVSYQGKLYQIVDIRAVSDAGLARTDLKMVCYLEEI